MENCVNPRVTPARLKIIMSSSCDSQILSTCTKPKVTPTAPSSIDQFNEQHFFSDRTIQAHSTFNLPSKFIAPVTSTKIRLLKIISQMLAVA